MQEKPLVSIVTPSYNQAEFIEDTLLSVRNQDYPNIEHIVVDGESTDGTLEILKNYEDKYNLKWISEPDEGQSNAINKGFRMSGGDIVGWINSDDVYWDSKVISDVVRAFRTNEKADLIYGDQARITKDNRVLRYRKITSWVNFKRLLRRNCLAQSSTFFRKELLENYKLKENLEYVMDREFWIGLAFNGIKFKHIDRLISSFRIHPETQKSVLGHEKLEEERERILKKYGYEQNFKNQLSSILDKSVSLVERIKELSCVSRIYKGDNKLVFPAKFDPVNRVVKRQIKYIISSLLKSDHPYGYIID